MTTVATTPKFQRNLFSKTLIGLKRERRLEQQNIPFSFTVDINVMPLSEKIGNSAFTQLPETYLFCNVPDDVSSVVITQCSLGFRRGSDLVSAETAAPLFESLLATSSCTCSSITAANINMNVYVLDANRRAVAKPITVGTLPFLSVSSDKKAALGEETLTLLHDDDTQAAARTKVKMSMPIGARSSVMISPSVASAAVLAEAKARIAAAASAAASSSSLSASHSSEKTDAEKNKGGKTSALAPSASDVFVPTVTITGYIVDVVGPEEGREDAPIITAEGAITAGSVASAVGGRRGALAGGNPSIAAMTSVPMNVQVKRLLLKMSRQSSLTM